MYSTRRVRLAHLTLAAVLLLASVGLAKDSATEIVDEDYRLRLRRPGAGWVLMPERVVRKIVPDAIVGARMLKAPSVYGCVIVERVPKQDLDWFAALILDNLPVENRKVVKQDDIEFRGQKARRTILEGRVSNLDVRYQILLFFRQGFGFQVTTWGLRNLTKEDGSDFQPFLDALDLLDGTVRVRAQDANTPDLLGTGWAVRDNEFRSALTGLHVVPPKGWRLVVGDELIRMNEDAEVGLVTTADPAVYVVFTPERAAGVARAAMEAQYAEGLVEAHGIAPVEALKLKVADAALKLRLYGKVAEQGFEFRHGVFWDDDTACQILAWYSTSARAAATPRLLEALAGVTRMPAPERAALHAALLEHGDQQRGVGPSYTLRGGRFVDFASGAVWHAPSGIRKLMTGQAARQVVEDARLVLRHDMGLDMDAATYHQKVLEFLWGADDAAKALSRSTQVRVEGRPALRVARATRTVGTQAFTYVVATGIQGKIGVRFMVWGYPGNVASSGAWVDAAIRGLHVAGAPTKAAERRDDRWIDRRLGFEMRAPGPQWRFREETPPAIRAAGSLIRWSNRSEYVQALGMCNVGAAENTQDMLTSMLQNATAQFRGEPQLSVATIAGFPGEQRLWPGRARIWTVVRGRMIFLLIHSWRPDTKPGSSIADILGCFRLLD